MAGRIGNSWALVKASAGVLNQDRELLVFPLMSGVAAVLVTASFFAPLAVTGGWEIFAEDGDAGMLGYVFGFLFYLAQYTVIFFFNTALVGAAMIRLDGGDPTVKDGFSIAWQRIGSILEYALLAATVGMVLRFFAERSGPLGRFVVGLIGMAWNLATFLAVPVLVTRDLGAIDTVKESASLFKRTWGEQVVGNFSMGWIFFLAFLGWALAGGAAIAVTASIMPPLAIPIVGGWILGFILLALVSSALKGVYAAALFRYATDGDSRFYDERIMANAFRPK
jgi:hypothetical protein